MRLTEHAVVKDKQMTAIGMSLMALPPQFPDRGGADGTGERLNRGRASISRWKEVSPRSKLDWS
jgi:hypothetical protein